MQPTIEDTKADGEIMWTTPCSIDGPVRKEPLSSIDDNTISSTTPTNSKLAIDTSIAKSLSSSILEEGEIRSPLQSTPLSEFAKSFYEAGSTVPKSTDQVTSKPMDIIPIVVQKSSRRARKKQRLSNPTLNVSRPRSTSRSSRPKKRCLSLRRKSLKLQTERERQGTPIETSTTPASEAVGVATDGDDSVIILSPADSQNKSDSSATPLTRFVSAGGGGHYRSTATGKQKRSKRLRLTNSPSSAATTASSSSNITIDLVDDDDNEQPEDGEIIMLSDEDSRESLVEIFNSNAPSTSTGAQKEESELEVEIIGMKSIAPTTPRTCLPRLGRRPSLTCVSVKRAADRVRKRMSSSNLAKTSMQSHGIVKKKKNRNKKKNKGQDHNDSQRIQYLQYQLGKQKAVIPRRRHASPIFLLDRDIGPGAVTPTGLEFKSRGPSTSWNRGPPPFIPIPLFPNLGVNNPFNMLRRPFLLNNNVNQPSTSSSNPPRRQLEPNFSSLSNDNSTRVPGSLRPIVIDGSNVAMGHTQRKVFSCLGIEICVNYFRGRGHDVTVFVPQFRRKASESVNPEILEKLENQGVLKYTPSREVGNRRITAYDDRFIVQYAHLKGAIIVSNDNFRDLQNEMPECMDTLEFRILNFTWGDEKTLMFPIDPLGKNGPWLDQFLRYPVITQPAINSHPNNRP